MSHVADPNKNVTLTIDGISVTVPEGTLILDAAKKIGINIPVLCYHPDLKVRATCRICMVELKGQSKLKAACGNEVWEGAEIITNSKKVRESRKLVLEMILAEHPQDCLQCVRNCHCELQQLAREFGLKENRFEYRPRQIPIEANNPAIVRDMAKCIQCGRCVAACQDVQTVFALTTSERSIDYDIGTAFDKNLDESVCTFCGQCVAVCPVGALYEKDDTGRAWKALDNPEKHVVVQVAPAVRVALGEEFGMEPGAIVTGKMVAALRHLGFDRVFDTNFTADLTIMEEGSEFIERFTTGGTLPMITSCSPGWVNFIETFYPDLLDHLSTCKSPQQMFGALAKTYYAEQAGIDPKNIVSVSIMPCTAKKYECARPEMTSSGYQDVDIVLTTRELAQMIKEASIDLTSMTEEKFDAPLGIATGAGVIFGATGGVMEAALRTVAEVVTGKPLSSIEFENVRGLTGIKEAVVPVGEHQVKIAVAHTLGNARKLLEKVRKGEADYHFIEVMTCPGGCISGGGQPRSNCCDIRQKRVNAIYECDKCHPIRKSHENPAVKELYETWLGKPLGEKSHHLLHTHYHPKNKA